MRQIKRAEGRDRLNDDIRAWQVEEAEAFREAAEKAEAEAERRIQAFFEYLLYFCNGFLFVNTIEPADIEDDEETPAK